MTSAPTPDYYEILGVERDATADEIRTAWRALTRVAHPDAGGSAGMFRLIMEASETLLDPSRRATYDAGGGAAGDSNPEEWSTESDDGGYYEDDADSDAWQDVDPQPRTAPAPSPGEYGPAHAEPGSYHNVALRLALGIVAVTVVVAVLVATALISPWYMAGVVGADAVGIAAICPRRWERVAVAIVALLALGELSTIRVGDRGAHMAPTEGIPMGAIATGAAMWISHRRRS